MAQIAILAAIEVGLGVAQAFLTPKPKQQPLDKGRLDDLRFQTAEEGGTLPKIYGGPVRMAGNIIDASRTQEHKTTTPGRSGGKGLGGGGRQSEPPTTYFTYTKTFAIEFCAGPIRSFLEIRDGDEVIYNLAPAGIGSSYYQAEQSGNTLAGGAVIAADATCAGGYKVNVPNGGSVQWNAVPIDVAGTVTLVIYYISSASISATVRVNSTDYPVTLPSTSGVLGSYALDVAMNLGTNTVKITNGSASTLSLDQIFAFRDMVDDATGVIHPTLTYPTDLDNPRPFYDYAPYRNGRGEVTGSFAAGGQSPFELYLGTEDQLQSPTLVALHGAANVSAYRGVAYLVANQYTLKTERFSNSIFTAKLEPWINDLGDCLADMYLDRGAAASELDFSALNGTVMTEGFVVDRRAPLSDYVDSLQLWYNFDLVPAGGKIKAVKRGASSVISIPEAKLRAHEENEEAPQFAVGVDHHEDSDIPLSGDVIYLDQSDAKEFHTGTAHYTRQVGSSVDPSTWNFPLVAAADTAAAVVKRLVYEQVLRGKPLDFATGPEFRYLLPTDVVDLVLSDKTWKARIDARQAGFNGLIRFRAIPEKAALYTQTGVSQIGTGSEVPPVVFPPNTVLALLDIFPLRLEDDALGFYVAVCPRGQVATIPGQWHGCHLKKEEITGTYDRLTGFDRASTIGLLRSSLSAVTDTLSIDRNSTITVDLYNDDGLLASVTEETIQSRPINQIVIGSGAGAEIVRFATVTQISTASGYVASYQLTNLLRGLHGTEYAAEAGHSSGKTIVLLNDAVKFRREDPAELRRARNYKAVSVGQAEANAPVTAFTFEGYSKKHLRPTGIRGWRNSASDAIFEWLRRARLAGIPHSLPHGPLTDEEEKYLVEILSGATVKHSAVVRSRTPVPVNWSGTSGLPGDFDFWSDESLDPYDSLLEGSFTFGAEDTVTLKFFSEGLGQEWFRLYATTSAAPNGFKIDEWNGSSFVNKYSSSTYDGSGFASLRVRFQIINGEIVVYEGYQGDANLPVYRSGLRATDIGRLQPKVTRSGAGNFAKATIMNGRNQFIYPAALQTAHFGSLQALGTLSVRITQYSALLGPGIPATALV